MNVCVCLQGETKVLKLKNLRPQDFANYTCQVSVRNVCDIPDSSVTFRLTNSTSEFSNTHTLVFAAVVSFVLLLSFYFAHFYYRNKMTWGWSLFLRLADSGKLLENLSFLLKRFFSPWLCVDLSGLIYLSLITSSLFPLVIHFSSAFSRSLSVSAVETFSSEQHRNSHVYLWSCWSLHWFVSQVFLLFWSKRHYHCAVLYWEISQLTGCCCCC